MEAVMAQEIVGSNMTSDTGYGKASYQGPSSDTPGKNTHADFPVGGVSQDDLTAALARVNPKDGRDTVRDASGKGNPAAPKDFKQPKFNAPQTRTVSAESYPLAHGMDQRSSRS